MYVESKAASVLQLFAESSGDRNFFGKLTDDSQLLAVAGLEIMFGERSCDFERIRFHDYLDLLTMPIL
jgi:hypothetical protein